MPIRIVADNETFPVRWLEFSDGASQCWVDPAMENRMFLYISLSVCPSTPANKVMDELVQIVNALKNLNVKVFNSYLVLNYLPYGRADRVFEKGNPNGLESFANFLSWMKPDEIFFTDPHNAAETQKLFNFAKVNIKEQWECFMETVRDVQSGDVLCAPDKGALDKTHKLQMKLDNEDVCCFKITAEKKRDIETGRILSVGFQEDVDVKGRVVYIVDDLADGMGTFIPLAEQLKYKGAKEVRLYVTHMIASKGLQVINGYIDKIYCYQIVGNFINTSDIEKFNAQGRI